MMFHVKHLLQLKREFAKTGAYRRMVFLQTGNVVYALNRGESASPAKV
jgi:hypothetical protein